MNPFEAYQKYIAIKLHFTSDSYDYFAYNGSTTVSIQSFEKSIHKWRFEKFAKRWSNTREYELFLVANMMVHGQKCWPGALTDTPYLNLKRQFESISYCFNNELETIYDASDHSKKWFKNLFITPPATTFPPIVYFLVDESISLLTFIILDDILNIRQRMLVSIDKTIDPTKIFVKVKPFIVSGYNKNDMAKKLLDFLQTHPGRDN